MKKLLSFLMAAMLLPLAVCAAQSAPARIDLQPNQKILGHYTTDDVTLGGCWGMSVLYGERPIATDLTPDELSLFQGSKIVAFRVGLSVSTPVTRVFAIPVAPDGTLGEEMEWACNVSDEGWNLIELETPYEINLPDDYSLRIGFDYLQEHTSKHKPISAVPVGTIYPTMCYYNGAWRTYGVNVYGNLSLQCIAESDNFPQYVIRMRNLFCKSNLKVGDELPYSFEICNFGVGEVQAGDVTLNVAIDGDVVKAITNPAALTDVYAAVSDVVPTDGLAGGIHTLTVSLVAINGEAVADPVTLSSTFKCFEYGFSRQMRLVEQFTSTYCTWCPLGSSNLAALSDLRGDIAWVGIHENMGTGIDPFRTLQCDTIANMQGCNGYPEGSFDRYLGSDPDYPNMVCAVLSYEDPAYGAAYFNNFLESVADLPSWATVNINSTYDAATRKAVITIDGEMVPNFDEMMGANCKLTVYITEDGLVARQYNRGNWVEDYVHNGVLRKALGSAKGVKINRTGDTYTNEFTVNIPTSWNADNLNVVAFISRPLGNALNDLYVTNANKRKLGEFDNPVLRGDVNGDGIVGIDDVTTLIGCLLSQEAPANFDGADCYVDGRITIDDVTVLINFLLMGQW